MDAFQETFLNCYGKSFQNNLSWLLLALIKFHSQGNPLFKLLQSNSYYVVLYLQLTLNVLPDDFIFFPRSLGKFSSKEGY